MRLNEVSDTTALSADKKIIFNRLNGFTIIELMIAIMVLAIAITASVSFFGTMNVSISATQDRSFAIQKAISIISELRGYAEANESAGGASTLDIFDDGVGTNPILTIDSTVSNPDHILSGNTWTSGRWYYARRITVRKFASFEASNVRIVTVKIFKTETGQNDATIMADITSVVSTSGDTDPTTQVYDVYMLGVENIPGWWVYLAYLTPFIENALSDMESRNPGMEFRRHWVTKAAYGRDQEYKPFFNDAVDSNADINYAYFYPGSMPSGSAVNQYYVPGNVKARVNIDGTTTNDYNATSNPYPYALADQYNHAMRYPDELALYNNRLAAGQEAEGDLTYRLLLDDMILNPTNYRNSLFINLHGELIPMPSIRNYSDAAKDPAAYPQWRAVTHPQQIRYNLTDDLKLRVYAYLKDPSIGGNNFMTTATCISLVIPNMNLTTATDMSISCIEGGTDQNPVNNIADAYTVISPAPTTTGTGSSMNKMYATTSYDAGNDQTVVKLYFTPLRTPYSGENGGLDTNRRLYGMDYIPCPVEAANNFSQNLTNTTNLWDVMANSPSTIAAGGALASTGGDFIYALRGGNSQVLSRYSISGNSWVGKANYGANVGAGGALVYVSSNGRIYALRGNTQATFKYYTEDSWTACADAPATVGDGGALACTSTAGFIYAFRGATTNTFWRYSISGNTWTAMAVAPATVGSGGALVSTGGDFIYAFRGAATNAFWRYSIFGNAWVAMTNAPGNVGTGAISGGALVYPGSGDFIYAFQGAGNTAFWRYSISGNSWTVMTATNPYNVGAGGALVYSASSGYIYGLQGNSSLPFLRCSTVPKNTARWIVTVTNAALVRELGNPATGTIEIQTRINDDLTAGTVWPAKNKPPNLSSTYIWRTNSIANVPFSERYQFQGDPRHCPYSDVRAYNGYNWYFDNLRDATVNTISEWPGISSTLVNGSADSDDGWHGGGVVGGDRMEIDVPRYFQFIRTALTGANCVYTSITGWSYYYMGIGNEIGYDSANGFTNSIPTSRKPFDGGTGTRNEQSITTDQTGGVKYIRESTTPYWWGMPWLGENYPDGVYSAQWTANGNLTSGSGANTFVRIRRQDITAASAKWLNRGTTFSGLACVRRTQAYGCTSFFNIGTTTSTFRHTGRDGTTGTITADGTIMANGYNFPMPSSAPISRPFRLDNDWGAAPTEFSITEYSNLRCTATVNTQLYGHQDGGTWQGSSLIMLANPAASNAFIVVNGLDKTVESGSAFIGRYAVVSLVHSFLTCGLTGTPSRIVQLPRVELETPNVATELNDPSAISITWSIEWKRWDGQKYTSAYADGFAETEADLRYVLLYSDDNGDTWKHVADNSAATLGIPNQGLWITDVNAGANEGYDWDVSDLDIFPEGSYILRLEAYRLNQMRHYSYHRQRIFINR
jgi:prepilin-type N-terminal cleavage/methylation domain-containing protein